MSLAATANTTALVEVLKIRARDLDIYIKKSSMITIQFLDRFFFFLTEAVGNCVLPTCECFPSKRLQICGEATIPTSQFPLQMHIVRKFYKKKKKKIRMIKKSMSKMRLIKSKYMSIL